tara:strand:+ start:68 stop:388 length:321 start_codon:yes stop_codon:yes gene_type:complete
MPEKNLCDCGSNKPASQCCDKPKGEEIGKVTHYFSNINVAVIKLSKPLVIGDQIQIKGATTDFEQKIDSMQVDHKEVDKAKKGDAIGLKVSDRVRENDKVYKACAR